MHRNQGFVAPHEPLLSNELLNIRAELTTGPLAFLNPTRAHYIHTSLTQYRPSNTTSSQPTSRSNTTDVENSSTPNKGEELASDIEFKWRSRDNRKGRHALVVQPPIDESAVYITPKSTHTLHATAIGIWAMCTQFPYWDVSWLVAIVFTLGSVVWCINGSFVFIPLVQPNSEFPTELVYGGGITAFIGATIFEVGSVLLMFEAVNENRAGCFGWALEKAVEGGRIRIIPSKKACCHHHTNKKNFVGKSVVQSVNLAQSSSSSDASANVHASEKPADGSAGSSGSWQWYPSTHELTTHYLRDIGFLACSSQMFGASVFWISGFTALPGINNLMSQGLLDGIYWTPQVLGGMGFVLSGYAVLFLLHYGEN